MISYVDSTDGLRADQLQGFFNHWLHKPSPEALLRILKGSNQIVLVRPSSGMIVRNYDRQLCD